MADIPHQFGDAKSHDFVRRQSPEIGNFKNLVFQFFGCYPAADFPKKVMISD